MDDAEPAPAARTARKPSDDSAAAARERAEAATSPM
jgi:hypothetical protein